MNKMWLIILWTLTLFFLFKWIGENRTSIKWVLKRSLNYNFSSVQNEPSMMKRLGNIKFFSQPGWIVKYFTETQKIEKKLISAGKPLSSIEFLTVKQLVVSIFYLYGWIYILLGNVSWNNSFMLLLIFVIIFFIPDLWLQIQRERRQKIMKEEAPYFIDLLNLTLDTGLNIEQSMEYVAESMRGEMAQTIRDCLVSMQYGKSFDQVMERVIESIEIEEFRHFIVSLRQAKKIGVSLSKTLKIQSILIQTKRRQKAAEISRTASVKISLPLVLFIFPALLVIYLGPVILRMVNN